MKRECHTIQTLLQAYLKYEILDTEIQCHQCKTATTTARQFYIAKSPAILNIQLLYFNRSNYSNFIAMNGKSKQQIWVQKEIKINNDYYLLSSAIIHIGPSRHNGHYICIGRSINDCKIAWTRRGSDLQYRSYGTWYYANDNIKRTMDVEEVDKYLLKTTPSPRFYMKGLHFEDTCIYIATYIKTTNNIMSGNIPIPQNMPSSQLFSQNQQSDEKDQNQESDGYVNINSDNDVANNIHFHHNSCNSSSNHHNNNSNKETWNFSTNYNQQYVFNSPTKLICRKKLKENTYETDDGETEEEEERQNNDNSDEDDLNDNSAHTNPFEQEGVASDGDTIMKNNEQLDKFSQQSLPNLDEI